MDILLNTLRLNPDRNKINIVYPGASAREYFRITGEFANKFNADSVIAAKFNGASKNGFKSFVEVQRILQSHEIPVPQIYEIHEHEYILIQQDVGSTRLADAAANDDPAVILDYYETVLNLLARIHTEIDDDKYPVFHKKFDRGEKWIDPEYIYDYDLNFHFKKLLLEDTFHWNHNDEASLDKDIQSLCAILRRFIRTPMYRDIQSSNIMIASENNANSLYLIDFQDMRIGIPEYDLASLLWDVYVPNMDKIRKKLLTYYKGLISNSKILHNNIDDIIHYSLLQRKLHDAGVFGFIWQSRNDIKYREYLYGCMNQIFEILDITNEFHNIKNVIIHKWENFIQAEK